MIKFPKIQSTPFSKHVAGAWYRLTNIMRQYMEHFPFTNTDTDLEDGELLYISGNRSCARAVTDTAAECRMAGVCCEPTASGAKGIMRTQGLSKVLFLPALVKVPAAGMKAFVSSTPGRATTEDASGTYSLSFGTIEDASNYDPVEGGYCYVNINLCCQPVRSQK